VSGRQKIRDEDGILQDAVIYGTWTPPDITSQTAYCQRSTRGPHRAVRNIAAVGTDDPSTKRPSLPLTSAAREPPPSGRGNSGSGGMRQDPTSPGP
jgi:hypothetical protein